MSMLMEAVSISATLLAMNEVLVLIIIEFIASYYAFYEITGSMSLSIRPMAIESDVMLSLRSSALPATLAPKS